MTDFTWRECPDCFRRVRVEILTDGRGSIYDAPMECPSCRVPAVVPSKPTRRGGAYCQDCLRSVPNRRFKRCGPCGKAARKEQIRARERTPKYRRKKNRKRRQRLADPGARAVHLAKRRAWKERNPESVRQTQNKANRKRVDSHRAWARENQTKYVGTGLEPTCRDCGAVIEWDGRGRPRLDCPDCRRRKGIPERDQSRPRNSDVRTT